MSNGMQRDTPPHHPDDTVNGSDPILNHFSEDDTGEVREFTQHIFEKSNNGFFEWFAPTDTFHYSRSFERMLGYECGELALNEPTITAHIFKEDFPGLQKLFSRSALLGEDFETQVRMYNREGKLRWYQVHVTVFSKTANGCTKNAIGSVADIDDIKVAQEESLRRAENEHWLATAVRSLLSEDSTQVIEQCLSSLCAHFSVDVCILRNVRDDATSFQLVNVSYHPRFAQRFHVADLINADDLPFDPELLLAGRSHVVDNVDQLAEDGTARKSNLFEGARSFAVIPIFYRGELDYFLSLVRVDDSQPWQDDVLRTIEVVGDALALVAARQDMSRTLTSNELRFQHALDATQDGIWDWDLAEQKFFVTPTFLYMLGYDEELLPLTEDKINQFFYEPTTVRDFFTFTEANPKSAQGSFEIELPLRHCDGRTVWVLVRAKYTAWNSAGEPTRCVGENKEITNYKAAQRKLITDKRRAQSALQQQQQVNQAALEIAIQVKQALSQSAKQYRQLDNSEQALVIAQQLDRQYESLVGLVETLQPEPVHAGVATQKAAERFDLHELLEELTHDNATIAQGNAVHFHLDIADNVPQWVVGSRKVIASALNAVLDAVLAGLHEASLMFHVGTLQTTDQHVLIRFSLQSEKMLDDVRRLDVCFDKVTQLNGEFNRSEGDYNSLRLFFTLCFDTVATVNDVESPEDDDTLLAHANVLLAEDNPINQQVAVGILKRKGVSVTVANNGREAIDALLAAAPNDYDLVLMDMEMPVLDGYQAARAIRQTQPIADIPIVALTAHAMKEDRLNCMNAGMNDHIPKPVKPDVLYSVIAKQLRERAAGNSLPRYG